MYIVTVCMDGKIIEQKHFYFVNEAFIYARDKRAEGYATEQRTVPNPEFRKGFQSNDPCCHKQHKQHLTINNRDGWAQRVICTDTGVTYPTMRECEKSVGISGYRIRNAIRKGVRVEGLRFEYA